EDINKIISYGVNIFLVGEVFMKSHNPGQKLKDLFFPL
ncbi:MAG: indole-3-glycerol-phosphate synthase, partial [Gammaproteobacteria bacterium]|nr:indole-3-glycerol-phosphate synthase [Gammaproteobacteria bacterium]